MAMTTSSPRPTGQANGGVREDSPVARPEHGADQNSVVSRSMTLRPMPGFSALVLSRLRKLA